MADVQRVQSSNWATEQSHASSSQQQQQHQPNLTRTKGQDEHSEPTSPVSQYSDDTVDTEAIEEAPLATVESPPPYSRHDLLHRASSSGYMRLMLNERRPSGGSPRPQPVRPQIIINSPSPEGEQQPLLPQTRLRKKRRRRSVCAFCAKVVCIVFVIGFIITMITMVAAFWGHWNPNLGDDGGNHDDKPDRHDGLEEPDGLLLPRPQCILGNSWKRVESLAWSNKDAFRVKEVFDHVSRTVPGDLQGRVLIVPGDAAQEDDFQVDMALQGTEQKILDQFFVNVNRTGFEFGFHELGAQDRFRMRNACTAVVINVAVAKRVRLNALNVNTVTHAIELAPNLHFSLDQVIGLESAIGSVAASQADRLQTRIISIKTVVGNITGSWPLYDSLALHTVSGVIAVTVIPREADRTAPSSADLTVNSASGAVSLQYITDNIPHRNYTVDVRTLSGPVHGTLIHGSQTDISTAAGDIDVRLLPFLSGKSRIGTNSEAGSTELVVLPPVDAEIKGWSCSHQSVAGSITLEYPLAWQGAIHAETMGGNLSIEGRLVEIIDEKRFGPFHVLEAKRGHVSRNAVLISSVSGDIGAVFD